VVIGFFNSSRSLDPVKFVIGRSSQAIQSLNIILSVYFVDKVHHFVFRGDFGHSKTFQFHPWACPSQIPALFHFAPQLNASHLPTTEWGVGSLRFLNKFVQEMDDGLVF
jgi:hypothetical protein